MLSLHTTENIISSIYQDNENKYDAWYAFITKLRPSLKILLAEDTDYDVNDYNPVYMLQNDYDIEVEPEYLEKVGENSYLSRVERMELSTVSDPFAVFILDVNEDTAAKISEKYGVICHSFSTHPESNPLFQEGIEKNIDKGERRAGWSELFTGYNSTPANLIVMIDRYLFSEDSGGITQQDGLDNIYEILEKALPTKLGVDFHVLIIFDATIKGKDIMTFNQLSSHLNGLKKRITRPYQIVIEVLSMSKDDFNYDETHNRRILSNYYIVRADHSLKAFKADEGLYTQSMWIDWAASRGVVSHKSSDAPYKALYKYMKETVKAIDQLQKKMGGTPFSQNGNYNVSIKSVRHRIMQTN